MKKDRFPIGDPEEVAVATCVEELTDDDVRRFFETHPEARSYTEALAAELARAQALTAEALTEAYVAVLTAQIKSAETLCEDDEFLQTYIYPSQKVKAYFESLLERGSVGTAGLRGIPAMTAAKKPITLSDAGEIASKIL